MEVGVVAALLPQVTTIYYLRKAFFYLPIDIELKF
jgi:hypothetical protein